jgi:uncharacterized membrane protein YraQ (UPF0718 family)
MKIVFEVRVVAMYMLFAVLFALVTGLVVNIIIRRDVTALCKKTKTTAWARWSKPHGKPKI